MCLFALLALVAAASPQDRAALECVGFEDEPVGQAGLGWSTLPEMDADLVTEVVGEGAFEGQRCLRVTWNGRGPSRWPGAATHFVKIEAHAGRLLRVRAALRTERGGPARLSVGVRRRGGLGGIETSRPKGIPHPGWHEVELLVAAPADASLMHVSFQLDGSGEAYLDDLRIEDVAALRAALPARPITAAGRANLLALARVFGYVRHFHPSDEVIENDWGAWLVATLPAVERAETPAELATVLQRALGAVAPTVRLGVSGAPLELPAALREAPEESFVLVRSWDHEGLGIRSMGSSGLEVARRSRTRVRAGALPSEARDPRDVFLAELPGGITCQVPMALYSTLAGTWPKPDLDRLPSPQHFGTVLGAEDRSTRLATVIAAWNLVQHFHPDLEVDALDWPTELERGLDAAATCEGASELLDVLNRMLRALGDGYARASWNADRRMGQLPFAWELVEGGVTVTAVPPSLAGRLSPGDVVTQVDGRRVAALLEEAIERTPAASLQDLHFRLRDTLVRGRVGETVLLQVERHEGGARVDLELGLQGERADSARSWPGALEELEPGLHYVDLARVEDGTFFGALDALSAAEGIVWDFRGQPAQSRASTILAHLINEPPMGPLEQRPRSPLPDGLARSYVPFRTWDFQPREPWLEAQHVFLVDGRTRGFAERLLSVLVAFDAGLLVGGASAGTNAAPQLVSLPGDYHLRMSSARVLRPDGSRQHGIGIVPDVEVQRTRAGVAEGRDELLDAALGHLRGALR